MQRRLVVNVRSLDRPIGGVERITREMLRAWPEELILLRPRNGAGRWRGHIWEQFVLPFKLSASELLWSPANTGPLLVTQQVLSLADVSPIDHPEWYSSTFGAWYRLMLPLLAKRVQAIITPSKFSHDRIQRRLKVSEDKIFIVPYGVNRSLFKPASAGEIEAVHREFGLQQGYFLFVSPSNPRKNLAGMLQAWVEFSRLYPAYKLLLIGSHSPNFAMQSMPVDPPGVIDLGHIDDRTLARIYAAATALVMPSFYEGFGLPALEAMASGTPVIVSNRSAIPEVVGDAGIMIDPTDVGSIVNALKQMASDPNLRLELRQQGLARSHLFNWDRCADTAAGVMRHVLQAQDCS